MVSLACAALLLYVLRPAPPDAFFLLCASGTPEKIRTALASMGVEGRKAALDAAWTPTDREEGTFVYYGESPLNVAVASNPHPEAVRVLLEAGANPNARPGRPSPLLHAVTRESAVLIKLLLQAGANPKEVDEAGKTLLHHAASNTSPVPTSLLLEQGLEPNAVDAHGNTPLHGPVRSAQVVTALAAAGADVNRENAKGHTPFEDVEEQALLDAFLAAGARLIWTDTRGEQRVRGFSPLMAPGGSHVRFFEATVPTKGTGKLSPVQRAVLTTVPLEQSRQAPVNGAKRYSEMFTFVLSDQSPVADVPYSIESEKGAIVFGRSESNGHAARVYTPAEETLTLSSEEEAIVAREAFTGLASQHSDAAQKKTTPQRAERVCFVHPENRQPAPRHPYFILTQHGYAIAGQSGEDGCSPEFFAPPGDVSIFAVYGGQDAARMNVLGSWEDFPVSPTP